MTKLNAFHATLAGLTLLFSGCKPPAPEAVPATPSEIVSKIRNVKKLTLVHVWATWCAPCRDEFPELMHVIKEFPKLDVILVSGDDPKEIQQVNEFLAEYESPIGSMVSTELNQEFIEAFSPEWAGSLPATFFYSDGRLVAEWEGKRTYEEYKETIETLLK
jgi:thiol-disulfide isomerase/thioredoxin